MNIGHAIAVIAIISIGISRCSNTCFFLFSPTRLLHHTGYLTRTVIVACAGSAVVIAMYHGAIAVANRQQGRQKAKGSDGNEGEEEKAHSI